MSRLERLIARLRTFYGILPVPPHDPFALFVWEVLSAHSTPRKRDAALAALKRIPALTPGAMSRAPRAKLEASVGLAGPYVEQRLQALRTGIDLLRCAPDLLAVARGPLPAARRALKRFPGPGQDGVDRMLLFAGGHVVLPVDTHVHRVGLRLGYGRTDPDFRTSMRTVKRALAGELARSAGAFRSAFVYLSHHGAATCTEGEPRCAVCPLVEECPEGKARAGRNE